MAALPRLFVLLPLSVLLCACWSIAGLSDAEPEPAKLASGDAVRVVKVLKGDEVVVEKDGAPARVRLLGVLAFDTELTEPSLEQWRQSSVQFLTERLLHRTATVTLGNPTKDAHERFLGYLEIEENGATVDLSEVMLRQGLSMVYTEFAFGREQRYLAAEAMARQSKKGLWAHTETVRLVRGLRQQWAQFRRARDGGAVNDPVLPPGAKKPKPRVTTGAKSKSATPGAPKPRGAKAKAKAKVKLEANAKEHTKSEAE